MAAVGLAHFARPTSFEPINRRLGFTTNTRRHVYVNGAIETAIGLLAAPERTRPMSATLGAAYGLYLTSSALHARLTATPG